MNLHEPERGEAAEEARGFTESRDDSNERFRRLFELTSAINRGRDLRSVLSLVQQAIVDGSGFDRCGLFLFDPAQNCFVGTIGTARDGSMEASPETAFRHRSSSRSAGLRLGRTSRILRSLPSSLASTGRISQPAWFRSLTTR